MLFEAKNIRAATNRPLRAGRDEAQAMAIGAAGDC